MNLDEQRKYGRTDLTVSVLGFGGNALGNLYDVVEEEAALTLEFFQHHFA